MNVFCFLETKLILIFSIWQKQKSEVSEDPARRYFNAFPALSDQSQADYSHKKASWPHVSNTDSGSSSSSNINSFGSNQPSNAYPSSSTGCGSASASSSGATAIATKKKTKRRRVTTNSMTMASNWSNTNQFDAKAAASQPPMQMQMQSSKVTSSSGSGSGAISSTTRMSRNANQTKSTQRKKPSDMWDTDFDGAWEMGRDLIREFVLKQNNRNRSMSECDTTVATALSLSSSSSTALQSPMKDVMIESAIDLPSHRKDGIEKRKCTNDEDEENLMRVAAAATSALFGKNFDMNLYAPFSLCDSETVSSITDSSGQLLMVNDKAMQRSEGYSTPDTLASWNEIETAVTPRRDRDYESMQYATMDASNAKLGYQIAVDSGSDCVDSGCDENTYAAFEAKFDHNVEALWNDCKSIDDPKSGSGTMTMMMDGQHSFWFDYDKQITNQNTTANVDQFKQFFQTNPSAINSYAMHGGFGGGGAELNRGGFATVTAAAAKLAAVASSQANASLINANTSMSSSSSSTAVPPMPSIGGMNLTSTIWTDTPNNNEDDVSFYANARLWEMNQSKSMGRKLNVSSINQFQIFFSL